MKPDFSFFRTILSMLTGRHSITVGTDRLLLLASLFLVLFYNAAFFDNVIRQYSPLSENFLFVISLGIFLVAITSFLLGLFCYRHTLKPVLMILFPIAALTSYFMNRYNVVVDSTMVGNVFATDSREVRDLFDPMILINLVLLGLLPAWWVKRLSLTAPGWKQAILSRVKLLGGSLLVIMVMVAGFSQHYASFFREHKQLRYYTNPLTPLYSMGRFTADMMESGESELRQPVGLDAHIPEGDPDRELIILVVGETARADHFSLNGYERATNPELSKYDIYNFPDVTSCATSTAISLPCMFSVENMADFDMSARDREENLLDVLHHADVDVLWRDNNSDSKGIAVDISEQDFRRPENNPVCDVECRDVGMLAGLREFVDGSDRQDVVIVLHQMGNHGPAYYKRYPDEFGVFTPVCDSNDLENCTREEIVNAYDNAIMYTDYFLAQVIEFLMTYDDEFETAMLYMSDHGESLGEYGVFLHGMPNFMAPAEQRQVPAIMWFGKNYGIDKSTLHALEAKSYNHDNFFHTVLGLIEIQTRVYNPALDIIRPAHTENHPAGHG